MYSTPGDLCPLQIPSATFWKHFVSRPKRKLADTRVNVLLVRGTMSAVHCLRRCRQGTIKNRASKYVAPAAANSLLQSHGLLTRPLVNTP